MENRGWIKLYRSSLDSLIFRNLKLWQVWCYCLLRANHKGGHEFLFNDRKRILKAGQFITGRIHGASDCHMVESTFRNQLKKLEKLKSIELKADNQKTIVTVLNWTKYQKDLDNKEPED